MPGKTIGNALLLILTLVIACTWAFPIYWAIVTSIKPEQDVVNKTTLIPDVLSFSGYYYALFDTKLSTWYLNSVVTSVTVTVVVILISVMCAYALSQIVFPGRKLLYGIILPQLIVPVIVIVYKQFFDSVPKELREAAKLDGCGEFQILFKLYLPLNWGITTALAIITYIMAWNAFLWPFLVTNSDDMMTITVGITQTRDAFGVKYARDMAVAILAAMPVAVAYLLFQKRVTQALMLSSGIKG